LWLFGVKYKNWDRGRHCSRKGKGEEQWDVWTYAIPQSNFGDKRIHPTQKPLKLYKHNIESASHTGDNILDCFAGSGTTGHAAMFTGRDFTLIEQNDEKQIYTASLYKQKNMMFLYVRSEQKDESIYVKVDRIQPKLLLREEMDYDEVAEMLSKPPELLQQKTTEVDYAFEGTRVQ